MSTARLPAAVRSPVTAGVAVAVAVGTWMTAGAWGPRPISGDDTMALLIRADRGITLARSGHLDGWAPDFILGYQQFLYYGPGFSWAVGLVRLLTFGMLSTEGALKVVAIAAVVAVAPATAFLARSAGLSRRAAGVAAVLALAVDNVFGLGIAGTFTIALVPHQLAASFFCVALGCAFRTMTDERRRWVALLAVAVALSVVTHLITTVVLGLFTGLALPFLLLTDRLDWRGLVRLVAGGLAGAALAGFWTVPYLGHFGGRGEVPAWATPPVGDRIRDVLDGNVLFGPNLGWLVLVGWVYGVAMILARKRWAAALVAVPIGFLAVSHTLASRWPEFDLSPQLANRGLGYAGLVALLPLAALVSRAAGLLGPRVALPVALAAAVVLTVVVPGSPRSEAKQQPEAVPQMAEAARQLAALVPNGARFATHRDFPAEIAATGVSHPDFWLARASRTPTLNVFGLELSPSGPAAGVPETIGRVSPDFVAGQLARLGTSHVVTVNDEVAAQLDASDRYRRMWQSSPLAIFEVLPDPGQPSPAMLLTTGEGDAQAVLRRAEPEAIVIDVRTSAATEAVVAVGYSDKWRVTVEDRPQPFRRTPEGAIGVQLPIGESRLALRYERDVWDRLGLGVSVLAVLLGAVWALRRSRAVGYLRGLSSSRRSSRSSRTA